MEDSLRNWNSHLELEKDIFNQSHINSFDQKEFLRQILQRPDFSPESEGPFPYPSSTIQNNTVAAIVEGDATSSTNSSLSFVDTNFEGNGTLNKSNSFNSIMSQEKCASSPPTYLWSLDNSNFEPIIREPFSKHDSALAFKKRSIGKDGVESVPRVHQARKKVRSLSLTQDHIMAERKRRQELTGNIIALSAIIPGLKKMDKAYVLREAVDYMKKLQERVKELENQNEDGSVDSAIFVRKSQISSNKSTSCCETNSGNSYGSIESLLEVEAKILEKEVLIGIRCEKQKNIVLKIHVLLEKLHLSVASSSVLPFGSSTLIITIIAQMDDEYNLTMDDLVKKLREDLVEARDMLQ